MLNFVFRLTQIISRVGKLEFTQMKKKNFSERDLPLRRYEMIKHIIKKRKDALLYVMVFIFKLNKSSINFLKAEMKYGVYGVVKISFKSLFKMGSGKKRKKKNFLARVNVNVN